MDAELTLSVLDEEARGLAPRLFALYGVRRERLCEGDDGVFLAFGMEFDGPRRAIMWAPGMTWHSDSADSILERYFKTADARLIRLGEPGRRADDYELAGG